MSRSYRGLHHEEEMIHALPLEYLSVKRIRIFHLVRIRIQFQVKLHVAPDPNYDPDPEGKKLSSKIFPKRFPKNLCFK